MRSYVLNRGETLGLQDARGTEVGVAAGDVWLTQPRDAVDYVLRPGERTCVRRRGKVLIYAFKDSKVELSGGGTVLGIWPRCASVQDGPRWPSLPALLRLAPVFGA
jgi:hypothetical protein